MLSDGTPERLAHELDARLREFPPLGPGLGRPRRETWFSDALAYLLDHDGPHGLGSSFAEAFFERVGELAAAGGPGGPAGFRAGTPTSPALGVAREVYLPRPSVSSAIRTSRFADLVCLDLVGPDRFVAVIENKLFTVPGPGQLTDLRQLLAGRFPEVPRRIHILLTLMDRSVRLPREWIGASWVHDVLPLVPTASAADPVLEELRALRSDLALRRRALESDGGLVRCLEEFRYALLREVRRHLLEDLNRFTARGTWSAGRTTRMRATLLHSSVPARPLQLRWLSSQALAVFSRRKGRERFPPLAVPLDLPPLQLRAWIRETARSLMELQFDRPELYRVEETDETEVEEAERLVLFEVGYRWRHELPLLVRLSSKQGRSGS